MALKYCSLPKYKHYKHSTKICTAQSDKAADYVSELAFEEGDDHMDDILDLAEKNV